MQISRGLVFEIASPRPSCGDPSRLPQVTGLWVMQSAGTLRLAPWGEDLSVAGCLVIAFSELVTHCLIPLKALAEYRLRQAADLISRDSCLFSGPRTLPALPFRDRLFTYGVCSELKKCLQNYQPASTGFIVLLLVMWDIGEDFY